MHFFFHYRYLREFSHTYSKIICKNIMQHGIIVCDTYVDNVTSQSHKTIY